MTMMCQMAVARAQVPADTLEPFLDKLSDEALRQYLLAGVGVIHDTLTPAELETINLLFKRGAIQVHFHRARTRSKP